LGSGIAKNRISQSANKQWIQFDGSIKELEDLLHTDYHVFEHEKTGLMDVACEKYDLMLKEGEKVTNNVKIPSSFED
jgi:tripeptidyl-peptidase I